MFCPFTQSSGDSLWTGFSKRLRVSILFDTRVQKRASVVLYSLFFPRLVRAHIDFDSDTLQYFLFAL
jgi:hypothetical protein